LLELQLRARRLLLEPSKWISTHMVLYIAFGMCTISEAPFTLLVVNVKLCNRQCTWDYIQACAMCHVPATALVTAALCSTLCTETSGHKTMCSLQMIYKLSFF
jgi:hypothetical protein